MSDTPQRELPAYRSIKTVRALQIHALQLHTGPDGRGATVHPDPNLGYPPFQLSQAYIDKHQPKAGGYVVQYEDGYLSFSPAEAFEAGNVREADWGIRRSQEPKYGIDRHGRLYNRVSKAAIPEEEPVMVFRGKDALALPALRAYLVQLAAANADAGAIESCSNMIRAFEAFAAGFPERMRVPNSPLAIV